MTARQRKRNGRRVAKLSNLCDTEFTTLVSSLGYASKNIVPPQIPHFSPTGGS